MFRGLESKWQTKSWRYFFSITYVSWLNIESWLKAYNIEHIQWEKVQGIALCATLCLMVRGKDTPSLLANSRKRLNTATKISLFHSVRDPVKRWNNSSVYLNDRFNQSVKGFKNLRNQTDEFSCWILVLFLLFSCRGDALYYWRVGQLANHHNQCFVRQKRI